MKLTEHFDTDEFRSRDGAPVPSTARRELAALCRDLLEPARRRFGRCTVHSGYRTAAHNRRVGGAPQSFHRYDIGGRWGVAADVTFATGTPAQWYEYFNARGAGGVGRYGTFVHVDNRRDRSRWSG